MARGKAIRLFFQRPLSLGRRRGSSFVSDAVPHDRPTSQPCLMLPEDLRPASTDSLPGCSEPSFPHFSTQKFPWRCLESNGPSSPSNCDVVVPSNNTHLTGKSEAPSNTIFQYIELSPKEIPALCLLANPSIKRIQLMFGVTPGTSRAHLLHYAFTSASHFQLLIREIAIIIHWADHLEPSSSHIRVSPRVLMRKQGIDRFVVSIPGVLELHIGEHSEEGRC